MNIDDILNQIVKNAQLDDDAFDLLLASHNGSRNAFCESFTKEVAQRYLDNLLEFDIADCAINFLSVWAPLETFSEFSWAIYRAFDEGEYLPPGQLAGTNQELYTKPMLRKAMNAVSLKADS
ncbi:hypothetical protein DXT88_20380 [Herbaspirillum lusitanum]|uniref:hypothetical protein n=1 Tax=Herbaspirillum lusitanum TaxID=213312 RepID=UPI0022382AD7|nr:hypothetical protein [Herbaspirillum lusitanum]MCW5300531.1 hypothetical protein [Herbaspirillum lusitanum]